MKQNRLITLCVCFFFLFLGALKAQTPAKPFGSNTTYANGLMQTNQTASQASATSQAWYDYWKKSFIKDCASNKALVMYDYGGSSAYSEGQGYGMLLTAYQGDKVTFDKLVKGYFDNTNSHGLMNWTVSCSGASGQNGATDGDLDAAMALLIANKQWPSTTSPHNYASLATTLIGNIKNYEFATCGSLTVQKGGDYLGGCNCTNPSYYATGYYRAFAKHVPGDAAFWTKAADDGLDLLLKATHPTTGLNPAWTDQSGSITTGGTGDCNNIAAPGGGSRNDYQFDAARTPWRIVVDYLWWGTPKAKQYLDKITTWANGKGINQIFAGHKLDGTAYLTYTNSAFVGGFAIGAMGSSNQTAVNAFYKYWVDNSMENQDYASGKKLDDKPYFQNSLRTMYHFVASGNFWNPYGSTVVDPPVGVVSVSLTAPANNASIAQGTPVNVTATASTTVGTITKVEFIIDGVVAGSDASSPYAYSTSTLTAGTHTIAVKATDSNGKTATSSDITITITAINTSVVTVNLTAPASGASFVQGNPINMTASASTTNGATITGVEFIIDGVTSSTDNTSPYSYSVSNLSVGTHTIVVKAMDSNTKTASTTSISITITEPNNNTSVVTVDLTTPTAIEFNQGTAIDLTATASSTNSATITKVEFYIDGSLVSTDNSSPYTYSISNLSVGQHTLSAKAYDSNNQSAITSVKTITVKTTDTNPSPIKDVLKTSVVPVIDGSLDPIWGNVTGQSIEKVIIPTISGPTDLSANFKALWDDQYFYILVQVTDDVKKNDSGNEPYKDDAVELFFDINNDKATTYDNNDVQYTFRWNDNTIYAGPSGRSTSNVEFKILDSQSGYVLEARIPWSTLQGTPVIDKKIGLDVHVNDDDDGGERDGKISWASASDDAWQNPSLIGVGNLGGAVDPVGLEDLLLAGMKVYPNPFTSTLTLEGVQDNLAYSIVDLNGKTIQTGVTTGIIHSEIPAGLYNLVLVSNAGKQYHLKLVKAKQ